MADHALRVLIVDDREGDALHTKRILGAINDAVFKVDWVDNYADAITEIASGAHDIYLVDHDIDTHTGIEVLQEAKRLGVDRPMLLLTGHGSTAIDIDAMRHGAADYLEKDELTAKTMERAIRHALERTETLEALRKSEERFSLAVEGANDGVWDWDLIHGQVYYSPRWKALIGYGPEELRDGTPAVWLDRVHHEDIGLLREVIGEHATGRINHIEVEVRMRRRNGEYRWMLVRGLAVRDTGGIPYRMAGSLTDVTERRAAQERLISHVSHELRTPLTAIYQFTTNLRDGLAGEITALQGEMLDSVVRNVDQLKTMITDLVETTRMNEGKFAIEPARAAPDDILVEATQIFTAAAAAREVTLEARVPNELPSVYVDPGRIRQVLINLIDNALKSTPSGGQIQVRAEVRVKDPDALCVEVRDSGSGISPEKTRAIFERLVQVDRAEELTRKGLGLGLYISKEIVTRHGGRIWVDSEPGRGSSFFFTMPIFSLRSLIRPVISEHLRRGTGLVLLEVRVNPADDPDSALGEAEMRVFRRTIQLGVLSAGDVLLPQFRSRDGRTRVFALACADSHASREMLSRTRGVLAERLGPELGRCEVIPHALELDRAESNHLEDWIVEEVTRQLAVFTDLEIIERNQ